MTRDECYAVLFLMAVLLSVIACWEGAVQWQ
jgi:hypothetical protein